MYLGKYWNEAFLLLPLFRSEPTPCLAGCPLTLPPDLRSAHRKFLPRSAAGGTTRSWRSTAVAVRFVYSNSHFKILRCFVLKSQKGCFHFRHSRHFFCTKIFLLHRMLLITSARNRPLLSFCNPILWLIVIASGTQRKNFRKTLGWCPNF